MASMSFIDEMKDKASRIIPSAYSEIMEETTSDILLAPNMQNIVFLCDSANANSENVTDIVRAVRRRMDSKSAKVQYFTIQVLDSLIKNCGPAVHVEVAETKGLLHDLFVAATRKPSRDGEREAHVAALTLILNMSLWFSGHSDEKVRVLMELADHVRKSCGADAFAGIDPDLSVQLKRTNASNAGLQAARQQTAAARRQRRQEAEYLRIQQEHALAGQHQTRPQTVKAIPLIIPTDEEVSGMLDACLVLAECLNTAEAQGAPIIGDELIGNVATQIRRDHRNLAMILSSGAEIPNMDVLFSVTDSQTSIIQRLSNNVKAERAQRGGEGEISGGAPESRQASEDFQVGASPSRTSVSEASTQPAAQVQQSLPPQQQQQQQHKPPHLSTGDHAHRRTIRQAADVEDCDDVEMEATPTVPPATSAIPTMDDLFGGTSVATASSPPPTVATASSPPPTSSGSSQPPSYVSSAFPQPSQSVDHQSKVPQEMSHQDEGAVVVQPQRGTSLNDDGAEDGDEFDNFLNSRLRK